MPFTVRKFGVVLGARPKERFAKLIENVLRWRESLVSMTEKW